MAVVDSVDWRVRKAKEIDEDQVEAVQWFEKVFNEINCNPEIYGGHVTAVTLKVDQDTYTDNCNVTVSFTTGSTIIDGTRLMKNTQCYYEELVSNCSIQYAERLFSTLRKNVVPFGLRIGLSVTQE